MFSLHRTVIALAVLQAHTLRTARTEALVYVRRGAKRLECGITRALSAALLLSLVTISGCERARISPRVTPESIRSITPGMSRTQVVSILGEPLGEKAAGGDEVLLLYAIHGAALHDTISFWIAVDNRAQVSIVYVKCYPLVADDYAIYEARRDGPVYEHPEFTKIIEGAR
jgi:hypothetical protein